ncbi:glycosyltransferase [Candidatus Woesebacteria bacterium]|nr:glycosyltransferase [Candidatus Woesebacteria bacterium]
MIKQSTRVSVILPTFNERDNILEILAILRTLSLRNKLSIECVVVDDNSTDGTSDQIKKLRSKEINLIVRKKERGLASAILHGIKKSSGTIVVVMDTDLNHDPRLIPVLVKNLKKSSMVIGSRFVKNGGMDNYLRYVASKIYNKYFLSLILGSGVSDNLSGYFVMYKDDLVPFLNKKIFFGYGDYFIRLIYSLKKSSFSFIEVPCYYKNRTYGESKSKFINMLFSYTIEAITYVHKK